MGAAFGGNRQRGDWGKTSVVVVLCQLRLSAVRLPFMDDFGAERIDHVTILVTDLDKARDFYARVLGLREVPRPPSFDFPGMWFKTGPAFLHPDLG